MASKEILGLLNGVRRVAVAFTGEISTELQTLVSKAGLPNTFNQKEDDEISNGFGHLNFPDWGGEYANNLEFKETQSSKEFEELTRSHNPDLQSNFPPSPTTQQPSQPHLPSIPTQPVNGTRRYHCVASPLSITQRSVCSNVLYAHHFPVRFVHTSLSPLNDTVVGSSSDSKKQTRTTSKPKVTCMHAANDCPGGCYNFCLNFFGELPFT